MEIHIVNYSSDAKESNMANSRIILTSLLSLLWVMTIKAEDADPCVQYNLYVCVYPNSTMNYSIAGYTVPVSEEPYVDSIWIMTQSADIARTMYAQAREYIDISFLENGRYFLFAQVGECKKAKMFIFRDNIVSENIQPMIDSQSSTQKILYNGQLLIKRDNKTFTVQGIEAK